MMNTNNLFRIALIAGAAALFSAPQTCEAQLLKALKNTVQGQVKEVTKKAKGKAEDQAKETISESNAQGVDSNANTDGSFSWYLDDQKYPTLYANSTYTSNKDDNFLWQMDGWMVTIKNIMLRTTTASNQKLGLYNNCDGTNKYTPGVERFLYPWTKAYIDNPDDSQNIKNLARAVGVYHNLRMTSFSMDDPYKGIIDNEKGWLLYWPSENAMRDELNNRFAFVVKKAQQCRTAEQWGFYVKVRYQTAKETLQKMDLSNKVLFIDGLSYYYEAQAVHEAILQGHPEYDPQADYAREIALAESWWKDHYQDFREAIQLVSTEPQAVPAGVSLDAATMQKAIAAAKQEVGAENFIKCIPLSKDWSVFKNPDWPYQVMHHSIPCMVVFKSHGMTVMQQFDLKRLEGKTDMSMMAGMGATVIPVQE